MCCPEKGGYFQKLPVANCVCMSAWVHENLDQDNFLIKDDFFKKKVLNLELPVFIPRDTVFKEGRARRNEAGEETE